MSKKSKFEFKNFAILVLFIVAIYQTGTLWLENYSGHNFFYYITSWEGVTWRNDAKKIPIDAQNITVGYGNKIYEVLYGSESEKVKNQANIIIQDALETEEADIYEDVYITDILEQRAVIYNMVYDSLLAEYIDSWGINPNEKLIDGITFDSIIIIPSANTNGSSEVFFLNSSNNQAVRYVVYNEEGEMLYSQIDEISRKSSSLQYISTEQSGFNIFSKNIFVPQWTQSAMEYHPVVKKEIFDIDDEGDMISSMDIFFGSYYGQSSDIDQGGVYTISDDYTVVKYYPDGIMEYYSYKAEDTSQDQNIYSAYYACKEFLDKDTNINTDYYLSGVQIKNSSIVFYFDYCVNNMPIVPDIAFMDHAIEVSVKDNIVRKYRRYAYDFELDESVVLKADKDFLDAVNETVGKVDEQGDSSAFENIFLGYAKDKNEYFELKWFTVIGDNKYETSTKSS